MAANSAILMAVKSFAKRLSPGADVCLAVSEMANHYNIAAGAIMSADGVLSQVNLMLPSGQTFSKEGQFILNSCTGTAAMDAVHLHLDLTTSTGEKIKGEALEGCLVSDVVDVVVGAIESSARS